MLKLLLIFAAVYIAIFIFETHQKAKQKEKQDAINKVLQEEAQERYYNSVHSEKEREREREKNHPFIPELSPHEIEQQKAICKKYGFDYVDGETMRPETLEWVLKGEREWRDEQERQKKKDFEDGVRRAINIGGEVDGHAFETFCATMLEANGFECEVTRGSGDHGADILGNYNGYTYAIQCKYYDSPVGNKAVQEALAGKAYYDTDYAVVLTNSTFTKQAIEDADSIGVYLWDGDMLNAIMQGEMQ